MKKYSSNMIILFILLVNSFYIVNLFRNFYLLNITIIFFSFIIMLILNRKLNFFYLICAMLILGLGYALNLILSNDTFALQISKILNYSLLSIILLTFWLMLEQTKNIFEENIELKSEIEELKGAEEINNLIKYNQFLKNVSYLTKDKNNNKENNYLLSIILNQETINNSKISISLIENIIKYSNYTFDSITQPEKNKILIFLQNTNTNELKENINKLIDKISTNFSLMILPFSMYIYDIEDSIEETLKNSTPILAYDYIINTSNINNP